MDRRSITDRIRQIGRRAVVELRRRPARAAGYAAALLLAVGIWSCQTSPTGRGGMTHMPGEPDVRVRIRAGVPGVKFAGPAEFSIRRLTDPPLLMRAPLDVAAGPEGCRITDGAGKIKVFAGTGAIEISGTDEGSASSQKIKVDGMSYPGRMQVLPRIGGLTSNGQPLPPRLDVIEVVPIETYLVGVVGAELYKDWSVGAFQVQAVCARTYALHERQRSITLGRDYDLESTTSDQAYLGGLQLPVAIRGVGDTRGVVITWKGQILRAYYSSTCGGRTASASHIWPTGKGYEFNLAEPIQAHHRETMCEPSPRYRWEVTRERLQLSKQIKEWGKANGSEVARMGVLASMKADAVNGDGRPYRYLLTDDAGKTYKIDCEHLRAACNTNVAGYPEMTRETRVSSSDMDLQFRGDKVVIRGRGFGHGVGMCQFCTKAMADRGDNWQDVVRRFYPGVKLERAY